MDNSGIISDNAKEYSETANATLSSQNFDLAGTLRSFTQRLRS